MSDYIEVLDETDPGSNLVGDTLIHTDMNIFNFGQFWPAEIDKKAGRPAGWSTGRPVEISNPD